MHEGFDRFLTGLHNLGNFGAGQPLVLVENEGQPLFFRQRIEPLPDGPSQVVLVKQCIRSRSAVLDRNRMCRVPTSVFCVDGFMMRLESRAPDFVKADIGRDPVQPGRESRFGPVGPGSVVFPKKDLLSQLFGDSPVPDETEGVVHHGPCMPGEQLFEGLEGSSLKLEREEGLRVHRSCLVSLCNRYPVAPP